MTLQINDSTLGLIHAHLESTYPEEGAGFLLGQDGDPRRAAAILKVDNAREAAVRHNRYLLTAPDMRRAEAAAAELGLDIIGIFHSHPDSPNVPSDFECELALPWYSYTITRVDAGIATSTRAWRLTEDRSAFYEEALMPNHE